MVIYQFFIPMALSIHSFFFAKAKLPARRWSTELGLAFQNIYRLKHGARFLGDIKVIAHVSLEFDVVKSQMPAQLRPIPLPFKFFRIVEKAGFQQVS